MRILAIDTALAACAVALVEGDVVRVARSEPMQRGHQERLATMTAEVLAEASLCVDALDRLAVTIGPGSFTGLRVGLAFAKGLALGADKPLVGVGVLEALIAGAGLPEERVAAVIDARHGRVHWMVEGGRPRSDASETAAAAVRQAGATRLTGPGAALLAAVIPIVAQASPDPRIVAHLAAQAPHPAAPPHLLYLRAPDARTLAERAAG